MAAPVPSVEQLLALRTDEWSALLAVALPVLRDLPADERDAAITRTVAVPPARLVGGRPRERFAQLVRRPGIWRPVAEALPDDVLAAVGSTDASGGGGGADPDELAEARARADVAEEQVAAATARAATLRGRLDDARRQAEGAEARATAAERRVLDVEGARDAALARIAELEQTVADAEGERLRAVERERRRGEARDDRDRDQLRDARRTVAELTEELSRTQRRLAAAEATAARASSTSTTDGDRAAPPRDSGRRARPSLLPAGVATGTREAASWLVGAGVPLLVDGYNVTRTQRPDASFEDQRRWLEDAVSTLARRRGLPATIVWDSAVGSSTQRHRSGLTVRYTTPEMTADDELVLHVETMLGPDDPVVVVTDDAELRRRLGDLRVDLLRTAPFVWLLR